MCSPEVWLTSIGRAQWVPRSIWPQPPLASHHGRPAHSLGFQIVSHRVRQMILRVYPLSGVW